MASGPVGFMDSDNSRRFPSFALPCSFSLHVSAPFSLPIFVFSFFFLFFFSVSLIPAYVLPLISWFIYMLKDKATDSACSLKLVVKETFFPTFTVKNSTEGLWFSCLGNISTSVANSNSNIWHRIFPPKKSQVEWGLLRSEGKGCRYKTVGTHHSQIAYDLL